MAGLAAGGVHCDRGIQCIVKDGVGNQTAGVVRFAVVVQPQRIARTPLDGAIAQGIALELVCVQRLDVSPVILVEVGESVIEVDGGADVVGDRELKRADRSILNLDAVRRVCSVQRLSPLRSHRAISRFE